MADDYYVLVRGPQAIATLAEFLDSFMGCRLKKIDDSGSVLYEACVMQLSIALYEPNFVNTLGIDFERYQYCVRFSDASLLRESDCYRQWKVLAPLLFANGIAELSRWECAVLADLEELVATFVPPSDS